MFLYFGIVSERQSKHRFSLVSGGQQKRGSVCQMHIQFSHIPLCFNMQ
jgi:hypothetical protein